MRAFSKKLDIDHTVLSRILNGKRKASPKFIDKFSELLNLSMTEKKYLLILSKIENTHDEQQIKFLKSRAQKIKRELSELKVSTKDFYLISDWYCYPLLTMIQNPLTTKFSVEFASEKLGITQNDVRSALRKFIALKLVEQKNGVYIATGQRVEMSDEQVNPILQDYHRKMLQKTLSQIGVGEPQHKFTGTESLALNTQALEEAKEILNDAFDQIIALSERTTQRDQIYHLSMMLFPLTK
jgi:uncharacterized protein (TIGR02147 family)